jgi:spore germination cell wall hydrolase CwlJ-like protein
MAQAISNRYYQRVVASTRVLMIVLGLVLVTTMLVTITQNKFNTLKANLESQNVSVITTAERTKQLECLSRNIYWEAASESFEGKVAVAQVTMNRVESGKFGTGVCGVVYQKNIIYQKVICQFSWVCEHATKIKPIHPSLYKESEEVAKKVLLENFRLPSLTNAMYYHADYINPGWKKPKITQIGHHIFYKE